MGGLWRTIQLHLHREAGQWRPREEPGDAGCAWCDWGGHNVTCDHFLHLLWTCPAAPEESERRRKNKPELPLAFLSTRREKSFLIKVCFSFFPSKIGNSTVVLLGTLRKPAEIREREARRPAIILDYNPNKGGVDNLDMVIGTYSCARITAHWPLVLFHIITDVSSRDMEWDRPYLDAWCVQSWCGVRSTLPGCLIPGNKRRVFLEQLGKALVAPHPKKGALAHTAASQLCSWRLFRGLNLVLIHPRLQLRQARGGDARSAHCAN